VLGRSLRSGATQSCGCNRGEHRLIDLTGQRFGRLVVRGRAPGDAWGRARWVCACDCGNDHLTDGDCLRSGTSQSCGCLAAEQARARLVRHDMARTPEYRKWKNMRSRCRNPNFKGYATNGGRGITVCDRWSESFENFYADMGPRPSPDHRLKRIDTDADYSADNCFWRPVGVQRGRWSFHFL
jgi:hypothetical protein